MDYYTIGYIASGILIIIALVISAVCQSKVYSAYNAYKTEPSSLNMTGAELARKLIAEHNLNLTVKMCKGKLSDNYNPINQTLNLSEENYNGTSIASHAIVAHEFGHALQHAQGYMLMKVRTAAIRASNVFSGLVLPLVIVGIILQVFLIGGYFGNILIYVSVGLYALAVIVNLVTLPVEYNASHRGKQILESMGCTSDDERYAVDKVLNAAALTYVAALMVSLGYFLRFLFILLSINRRD